jgi:trypsin-like peptidase
MSREFFPGSKSLARWPKFIEATAVAFVVIALALVHHAWRLNSSELQKRILVLSGEVDQLKQEQAMPSLVLNRYRDSICYIVGTYHINFPHQRPIRQTRISGTGFLVASDLIATNRHVAEPWYKDPDSDELVVKGARPTLEKMVAYFPGSPRPVILSPAELSADADLAILRMGTRPPTALQPLPLASGRPNAGELVTVVGYPMGVLGMMAKAPTSVYARLSQQAHPGDDQGTASELATLSLIRPSATCGHLGDVVGEKLIYDAPTAHGASGGPVFNSHGEVVGVNSAFIDGFSGGGLGIVSEALKPLMAEAQKFENGPKKATVAVETR